MSLGGIDLELQVFFGGIVVVFLGLHNLNLDDFNIRGSDTFGNLAIALLLHFNGYLDTMTNGNLVQKIKLLQIAW